MNTTRFMIRTTAVILIVSVLLSSCSARMHSLTDSRPKKAAILDFRWTKVYPLQIDDKKFYSEYNIAKGFIRGLRVQKLIKLEPGVHQLELLYHEGSLRFYIGFKTPPALNQPFTMDFNLEPGHLYTFKAITSSDIELVDLGSNKPFEAARTLMNLLSGIFWFGAFWFTFFAIRCSNMTVGDL